MLLDFEEQVRLRGLRVTGVLHVGAHLAEEAPVYNALSVPVVWVEANIDLLDKIQNALQYYPDQNFVIGRAVTDEPDGLVEFKITNYDSMSSSVFEFGTHPQFSPDTVVVERRMMKTTTIDTIMKEYDVLPINTLVMDIQGAELLALKGAKKFLPQVDYIYCEVNTAQVYVGCAQLDELKDFLPDFDYVAEYMVGNQGWGDGLFVRKNAPTV